MNAMKTDLEPGPADTLIYEQLVILPTLIEQAHEQGHSHAKIAAAGGLSEYLRVLGELGRGRHASDCAGDADPGIDQEPRHTLILA